MTLAEEFFNIAKESEQEKKIKEQIEKEKEKEILRNNTICYWDTYIIPLFQQRVKKGIYFINLKFAKKYNDYFFSRHYFPVEHVDIAYGDILTYKDYWDNSEPYIFKKYWDLPIDINEFINIIKANGFYIKNEEEYDDSLTVYDLEISCKPYPKTFRESLLLTDKENNFNNSGCSKGEMKIELLLIKNNIKYKHQFIFSACKYKKELPFDYAIFNEDNSIKCVIEYDGEQHFKYIPYWHKTEQGFMLQQLRDSIKTDFCKINNIPLIRIPYTHLNDLCIEDLLLETTTFLVV